MTPIEPYSPTIDRCGREIYLLIKKTGGEIVSFFHSRDILPVLIKYEVDFIFYNAFSSEDHITLCKNVQEITKVRPLRRHGHFRAWASGPMMAIGSRQSVGGRPADTYTQYAGMSAEDSEGMEILFNQAEVSILQHSSIC